MKDDGCFRGYKKKRDILPKGVRLNWWKRCNQDECSGCCIWKSVFISLHFDVATWSCNGCNYPLSNDQRGELNQTRHCPLEDESVLFWITKLASAWSHCGRGPNNRSWVLFPLSIFTPEYRHLYPLQLPGSGFLNKVNHSPSISLVIVNWRWPFLFELFPITHDWSNSGDKWNRASNALAKPFFVPKQIYLRAQFLHLTQGAEQIVPGWLGRLLQNPETLEIGCGFRASAASRLHLHPPPCHTIAHQDNSKLFSRFNCRQMG